MKSSTMTQGDWIGVGVAGVLTLISVLVFFLAIERTPVSPTPPPTVAITPAALPNDPPVMAVALPAGSNSSGSGSKAGGFGGMGGGMGRPAGLPGVPGGAKGGGKVGTPQVGKSSSG